MPGDDELLPALLMGALCRKSLVTRIWPLFPIDCQSGEEGRRSLASAETLLRGLLSFICEASPCSGAEGNCGVCHPGEDGIGGVAGNTPEADMPRISSVSANIGVTGMDDIAAILGEEGETGLIGT